jgi:hypothetical protein
VTNVEESHDGVATEQEREGWLSLHNLPADVCIVGAGLRTQVRKWCTLNPSIAAKGKFRFALATFQAWTLTLVRTPAVSVL